MVKNLLANAGNMGSITGPGRSHMTWGNSACAQLPSPCSATRAAHTMLLETSPCSLQLEQARVQQWRPSTAKQVNDFFLKRFNYLGIKCSLSHVLCHCLAYSSPFIFSHNFRVSLSKFMFYFLHCDIY